MYWVGKDGRGRVCLLGVDNVSGGWVMRGLLVRLMDCQRVKHGLYSVVPKMWGNVCVSQWLKMVLKK